MSKVIVKTPKEVVRKITIFNILYRTLRSFVESSLDIKYPWRMGYEFDDRFVFSKYYKWELIVYKDVEAVHDYVSLPTPGIYKITQSQIPILAKLYPMTAKLHVDFVFLNGLGFALLNLRYPYNIAFTEFAPIAFAPDFAHERERPFVRPITVREVLNALSKYIKIE